MSVWRGEDYFGLGEGAHGRIGLIRTIDYLGPSEKTESVTPDEDRTERAIFRLRPREGLDVSQPGAPPSWAQALRKYAEEGLLSQTGAVFRLTPRGAEVCDSILADLV